jgi:hypothetical protein
MTTSTRPEDRRDKRIADALSMRCSRTRDARRPADEGRTRPPQPDWARVRHGRGTFGPGNTDAQVGTTLLTCADTLRAGDGNRTRVASLEDWGSTIELRPHGGPGGRPVASVPGLRSRLETRSRWWTMAALHCSCHGVWRSLVAHSLWERGAVGSNPATPTTPRPCPVRPHEGRLDSAEPEIAGRTPCGSPRLSARHRP